MRRAPLLHELAVQFKARDIGLSTSGDRLQQQALSLVLSGALPKINFSVRRHIFPDVHLNFPCSIAQGICLQAIEVVR
jgi:hypothetical protein